MMWPEIAIPDRTRVSHISSFRVYWFLRILIQILTKLWFIRHKKYIIENFNFSEYESNDVLFVANNSYFLAAEHVDFFYVLLHMDVDLLLFHYLDDSGTRSQIYNSCFTTLKFSQIKKV